MAVYCELESVLGIIKYKTEVYYDAAKGDMSERLYKTSPREKKFGFSQSLERDDNSLLNKRQGRRLDTSILQQPQQQSEERSQNNENNANEANTNGTNGNNNTNNSNNKEQTEAAKTTTVVNFKPSENANNAIFKKEPIKPPSANSMLADLLDSVKSNYLQLTVFFPKQYDSQKVAVRVIDTETVEGVIKNAIKKYEEEERQPELTAPIDAYRLVIAEDNGEPDTCMPDLGLKAVISARFGSTFALTINPKASVQSPNISRDAMKANRIIKILLPDKGKTSVPYQPDMKISTLMRKILEKRNMNVADFHCKKMYSSTPISSNSTLEEVGEGELRICPNSELGGKKQADEDSEEISWNPAIAFRYKEYNVLKPQRWGHEERGLGVGNEHINIQKKKNGVVKSTDTKLISEVSKVYVADKPKQFVIEWSDGKSDMFSANSEKEAKEIVGKIEFILNYKS